MIRLAKIDRTMRPREIAPGVSLTMRPASSIDIDQAQGEASRVLAALFTAPDTLEDFGLGDYLPGTDTDAEKLLGLSSYLTAALLMEQIVESWEGVADESGEPQPFNRASIGLFLLHPGMKDAFEREAYSAVRLERDEGNGFAASETGSAGAAGTTAGDAGRPATTAERGAR
ncbi:hypothetical protein [Stappia sp. ES.058]|uniref:hypothetical protein n=1 Tax=Stappia sp. ES.058 TaxID=1881061 RepID=UPI00087D9094|nr:hypothetical protein [Stappia sp. ES.058]SDT97106.1 hypothetical protein SAMN05428979_0813 [Stappia sp. ES.058]